MRANLESLSHKCRPEEVAFVWELTKEPLGCLQGGVKSTAVSTQELMKVLFKRLKQDVLPPQFQHRKTSTFLVTTDPALAACHAYVRSKTLLRMILKDIPSHDGFQVHLRSPRKYRCP